MSTYVFSDVHGHRATLERVLMRVSPSDDDRIICLGDMIDRGPDPVGVLQLVRALPGAVALMGNHEDLMLSCIDNRDDPLASMNWAINGGASTSDGLEALDVDEANDLLNWVAELPRSAFARVGEQLFLMAHAGVRLDAPVPEVWDEEGAQAYLLAQEPEDLTWIREEFWGAEKGLAADGSGPIVIAGHTPTPYLENMAFSLDRPPVSDDGLARMVRVGEERDRWDIDCGAAGGVGFGQVLMVRLEDGEEFYEPVLEGE
ncbi:MAG: metallophosphoesterase family protein [Atopobiaceae bacterium]|nr:metallophosphoesterase family protein [Atopobiaceae bacterium]